MSASVFAVALLLVGQGEEIVVGSKQFPESVILGDMATILIEHRGQAARHRDNIGGTEQLWLGLLSKEIDIYPEYTGTLMRQILATEKIETEAELHASLAEKGVAVSEPLGFTNPYALGMKEEKARRLNIEKISDLKEHPQLRLGFSNEFMGRADGWKSLRRVYRLPQVAPDGLMHALAYNALDSGELDVIDTYRTDANIKRFGLRLLKDDMGHFPPYDCVFVYRADLVQRAPEAVAAIERLEGEVSTEEMLEMNVEAEIDHRDPQIIARNFLAREFQIGEEAGEMTSTERFGALGRRLAATTWQHLFLVVVSLTMAIAAAVPLGVAAAKFPSLSHLILSVAEIIQTIPGLALLAFLMPPVQMIGLKGIGPAPVILALFLYSLLPIIRNTYTGLQDIPKALRESAEALGLSGWERLWHIELPLASRMILAGIKTTGVIIVGYATLGALIGAGGYGQPIIEGMNLMSVPKMMEGAVPAALLALAVKVFFEWSERYVTPKGLRL